MMRTEPAARAVRAVLPRSADTSRHGVEQQRRRATRRAQLIFDQDWDAEERSGVSPEPAAAG